MNQAQAERVLGYSLSPGWSVREIRRGGVLSGIVLQKGCEIHAWRNPAFAGRWIYANELRDLFADVRRRFGLVTTKVVSSNKVGQRFVTRLGFVKTAEANGCDVYELGESKYAARN